MLPAHEQADDTADGVLLDSYSKFKQKRSYCRDENRDCGCCGSRA